MTTTVRILIVENHPAVREALAYQIQRHPDLELVGEAATVDEALDRIASLAPDVVVVDIALQDGDGIELIKLLRAQHSLTRILIWSMFEPALYADRARRAGAQGYITKEHPTAEIVGTIRRIHQGEMVFHESTARRPPHAGPDGGDAVSVLELSDRELEVFRLIGEGFDMVKISERLGLSVKTTETYRARIKQKLNIENRMELLQAAVKWVLNRR